MEVRELQWNCKRKQVSAIWLLRSGKVVRYKVEIPTPDPWILKEREVLNNEVC